MSFSMSSKCWYSLLIFFHILNLIKINFYLIFFQINYLLVTTILDDDYDYEVDDNGEYTDIDVTDYDHYNNNYKKDYDNEKYVVFLYY